MKNKKISVSIGIPAYNEEANIGKLIISLLNQNQKSFVLKEIVVVSDCSSDKTDEIVKGFSAKNVKLLRNNKRSGQAASQNKLKEYCIADIIAFINADMIPDGKLFLENLIYPMINNLEIGIACPRVIPMKSRNFFERIIYGSVLMKMRMFENWREGNNLFTCRGAVRAFRKELLKKITWPILTGEDTFTYFSCLKNGYKYKFIFNSAVYYRLPNNFRDHQRQSLRFSGSQKNYTNMFSKEEAEKEYSYPKSLIIKNFLIFVIQQPIEGFCYLIISILVKIIPAKKPTAIWQPSLSTKNI